MPERGWKKFERRVAALLGGWRIPVTGERDGADVATEMFVVQAKARGTSQPPPGYLLEWLRSIRHAAANGRGQRVGIVVWQAARGAPDLEALVVLRLDDWVDLHGPVAPGGPAP